MFYENRIKFCFTDCEEQLAPLSYLIYLRPHVSCSVAKILFLLLLFKTKHHSVSLCDICQECHSFVIVDACLPLKNNSITSLFKCSNLWLVNNNVFKIMEFIFLTRYNDKQEKKSVIKLILFNFWQLHLSSQNIFSSS